MAEVTGLRNNALPYPIYGVPFGVTFPMLDADGDLVTGATTPDAEVSKNGDTFADCTNESTEIATASGVYYLLLTGAEMTADVVTVIAKSASAGMKTTVLTLYPRKLVSLRTGTSQTGAAGSITLDASASAIDDSYNGCVCVAVIDTLTEARVITDYVGSTKVASVTPNWNVTPDADDTFTIYLPEGRQIPQSDNVGWLGANLAAVTTAGVPEVDVTHWLGAAAATPTVAGVPEVDLTHVGGSAQNNSVAQFGAHVVAADGANWNSGAITASTFATGAIGVGKIADGAITGPTTAASAVTKIAAGIWDALRSGHVLLGSFGQGTQAITGTAQAGGASTITLAAGASAVDDQYNGLLVCILGGTGEGQVAPVADYVGATKVATITGAWATQPDSTSVYALVGV